MFCKKKKLEHGESFSFVDLGYSVSLPMLGRDKKSLLHAVLFLSFQLGKTAYLYP